MQYRTREIKKDLRPDEGKDYTVEKVKKKRFIS
jgi:hypothetical protein